MQGSNVNIASAIVLSSLENTLVLTFVLGKTRSPIVRKTVTTEVEITSQAHQYQYLRALTAAVLRRAQSVERLEYYVMYLIYG